MNDQATKARGAKKDIGCLKAIAILMLIPGLFVVANYRQCGRMVILNWQKSKHTEAKYNLGSLFTAQAAYFGEYGTYAGGPHCFELLEWEPKAYVNDECYYTYWCGRDSIGPTAKDAKHWNCVNEWPVTTRNAFTVCAAGNADDEEIIIDTWSIRDDKNLRNDQNDNGLD